MDPTRSESYNLIIRYKGWGEKSEGPLALQPTTVLFIRMRENVIKRYQTLSNVIKRYQTLSKDEEINILAS